MSARKLLATALILWAGGIYAASPQEDLNTRVTRLEKVMDTQNLVEMLSRIESLQQEVQALRGTVEAQAHTIEALQRRQRELYLQIDKRLSKVEQANSAEENTAIEADGKSPEEQAAYQKAFELLRDMHYAQAVTAFREFLQRYPDGHYAHVAQYWIGEASYAQRDFKTALAEYQRLIVTHPESPKVPEAMLKIGASYHELGEDTEAVKILNALLAKEPDTTEAEQARALLRTIKSGK